MTVVTLPDIQQLVIGFLLDQTEIVDGFLDGDDRVYSQLPKTKAWPAVRVVQFNDVTLSDQPLWVASTSLQIDAFGGPKKTAKDLAETCRALLHQSLIGVHAEGVVSNVSTFGMRDQPDEMFTPAQPRWLFVVTVTAHPTSGS